MNKRRNTSLANALADRLSLANTPPWKVGTIKSTDTSTATCVVTILDADFVDIHYLSAYTPTVGDVVVLLAGGQQLLILGTVAPPSGS